MSCCGQKRAEWKSISGAGAEGEAAPTGIEPVWMRYLERFPVTIQGSATGRMYAFSRTDPVQAVAPSDAKGFEQSPVFQRVW